MTDHKTVREALESAYSNLVVLRSVTRDAYKTSVPIDKINEAISALDRIEAAETVTVEDIAMCIQDWKFNEENQQPFFGDYLAVKFPNGLRITKEK